MSKLTDYFGSKKKGAPPQLDPIMRGPLPSYVEDVDLSSLPKSFFSPVGGWEPCLRFSLRLQSRCKHDQPWFSEGRESSVGDCVRESGSENTGLHISSKPFITSVFSSTLSVYHLHFAHILRSVLDSPLTAHLFNENERDLAEKVLSLSPRELGVVSRFVQRKGPWLKMRSFLEYPEIHPDYGKICPPLPTDCFVKGAHTSPASVEKIERDSLDGTDIRKASNVGFSMCWEELGSNSALVEAHQKSIGSRPVSQLCILSEDEKTSSLEEVSIALFKKGLIHCFPEPNRPPCHSSHENSQKPESNSTAPSLSSQTIASALSAVSQCGTVPQLKTIASRLNITVTPAAGALPSSGSLFADKTTIVGKGQPSLHRNDYIRCLHTACKTQRTIFSGPLPLPSVAENVFKEGGGTELPSKGSGLPIFSRLSGVLISLLRRCHGLFYAAVHTSSLSSGQGSGSWPVDEPEDSFDLELNMSGIDSEGFEFVDDCNKEDNGSLDEAYNDSKSSLEFGGLICLDGESSQDVVEVIADSREESNPVKLASYVNPLKDLCSYNEAPHQSSKPSTNDSGVWASKSGSKYSDRAPLKEALGSLAAIEDGCGLPCPAVHHIFRAVDFPPLPPTVTVDPLCPIFHDRRILILWEAAHVFRSQINRTGVLGIQIDPAFLASLSHTDTLKYNKSTEQTSEGTAASKRRKTSVKEVSRRGSDLTISRSLHFPWEGGSVVATHSRDEFLGTPHLLSAPCIPPLLSGISLLPWASELLGVIPLKSSTSSGYDSLPLVTYAKMSLQRALKTSPSLFGLGSHPLPLHLVGASTLWKILKLGVRVALGLWNSQCATVCISRDTHFAIASAIYASLSRAPALIVSYRASLSLAVCQALIENFLPTSPSTPPWRLQLLPPSLLATILWESQDSIERGKGYAHTIPFLTQLTSMPYTPHRAGRWWLRMAVNLSHLGLHGDSLHCMAASLERPEVVLGDRYAIQGRMKRFLKGKLKGSESRIGEVAQEEKEGQGVLYVSSGNEEEGLGGVTDKSPKVKSGSGALGPTPHCMKGVTLLANPSSCIMESMPNLSFIRAITLHGHPLPRLDPHSNIPVDFLYRSAISSALATQGKSRYLRVDNLAGEETESESEDCTPSGEALLPPESLGDFKTLKTNITDPVCASFGVCWPKGAWHFHLASNERGETEEEGKASYKSALSVEGVGLMHYHQMEGWRGSHCEGSPLYSIWALLFWDSVIFVGPPLAPSGVFLSPYQDAPLDLDLYGVFSKNRRKAIKDALCRIARYSTDELICALGESWRKHYGQVCRGMQWKSAPLALLQLIAVGLGGGTLAALCDALAYAHRNLQGGLPDLLLWKVTQTQTDTPFPVFPLKDSKHSDLILPQGARVDIKFVEVKGPTDLLRDGQAVWLQILTEVGANASILKVLPHASQTQ